MKSKDSLFSFLKPAEPPGEAWGAAAAPAPVPPPGSPDRAKIEELENRIKKIEAAASGPAISDTAKINELENIIKKCEAAPESVRRELEKMTLGLKREVEEVRAYALQENSRLEILSGRITAELSSLNSRLGAAEAAACHNAAAAPPPARTAVLTEEEVFKLKAGVAEEVSRRLEAFDAALAETRRKALAALETSGGNMRRIDKLEEAGARSVYLEARLSGSEGKFERIYECEAAIQALKPSLEEMQKSLTGLSQRTAAVSAGQGKTASDLDSLSRQVGQLTALFNHFRVELAFLMPDKKAPAVGREGNL